jgi:hypothetical protein
MQQTRALSATASMRCTRSQAWQTITDDIPLSNRTLPLRPDEPVKELNSFEADAPEQCLAEAFAAAKPIA